MKESGRRVGLVDKGKIVEIRTDKISSDGSSLARLPDGRVLFVRGALPQETIRARVTNIKKSYATAVCTEVLEAHESRRGAFCPVFDRCGACQLQHASYSFQLELKRSILEDAFRRIYKRPFPQIPPCVPSPNQTWYRNKVSLPVRDRRGRVTMGYYARGSHEVVPMESCPVAADRIDDLFSATAEVLPALGFSVYDERDGKGLLRHAIFRQGINSEDALASLVISAPLTQKQKSTLERVLIPALKQSVPTLRSFTLNLNPNPGNVILGAETEAILGDGLLLEELHPFVLEYDTTSFFQVNTTQARALFEHTTNCCGVKGNELVLELFGGVGSLTSFLADRCGHVTVVEEWPSAVRLMKANMERNGLLGKTTILDGAVEKVVPSLNEGFETVVLDPPRTGCSPEVIEKVACLGADRIVYVSCNPATLARDAALLANGGYEIESLTCFDMFPQTVHVETVACFTRLR